MWNEPAYLWTVTLGHGDPDLGPSIEVTTDRNSRREGASAQNPEALFEDGAVHAAWYLSSHANLRGARHKELAEQEHGRIQAATDATINLVGWEAIETIVQGRPVPSFARTVLDAWTIVVVLPPVAVMVTGTRDRSPEPIHLELVTDRLSDYSPLS